MQKMLGMYKNICVHKVQLALQALYRTLTRPIFGEKPCPFCDNQSTKLSHFEHFITRHSPFVGPEFIVELLASHDLEPCPTVWARWCKWRFWQQGISFPWNASIAP